MEFRFVSHDLERGDYNFIPSHQVFFPGKEYSNAEATALLRQHDVDATLVILPGESGSQSGYVPPTYTSGCTAWSTLSGCTQVTTTQTGGYAYNKPWTRFTARLYDATTGTVVWVATATTGGNAYARSTTLVRSMADKTADRLVNEGLLPDRLKHP
jgi:hypothetical protein